MLNIIYTRAGQNARLALLERMGKCTADQCVLMVPDQYSHESDRALCRVLGSKASCRCEVLSFTWLARRLCDIQGGGAAPSLDSGGRMLLLYAALRRVGDVLKFYKTPSRKPAFLNSLLATVDECCSYGVSPERLIEEGQLQGNQQGDKWQDIGMISRAYLDLCQENAADPHRMLDRLLEQLKEGSWAENKAFFVHGFMDFTVQQRAIILELARQGQLTLSLVCDPSERDSDVFETALSTAAQLKRLASEQGIAVEEECLEGYGKHCDSLAFLEKHLFGPLPAPWQGECAVARIKAADPRREVEWAAAEILRLVRDEGYRWHDIAVCARRLGSYGELVESTFARFGIPVFESAMADVLTKPVLALVTAALAAVAQDYPYEEMFRYLKTDLVGISRDERDKLENYVITWNIRGSAWRREKDWDMHPEGYGLTLSEGQQNHVKRLDDLRRKIIAPLEKLRCCADKTGRGRAVALYEFLCEIGLGKSLEKRVAALEKRGQAAEAAQYRQLWDIVVGGLEQCALYLGDTPLETEEFSRLFSLVLSQYDVGTIPVSLDRVTVSEAHRMTHKDVKVLFFIGADGAAVPACEPDPGLFNDSDRAVLGLLDIELAPDQEKRLRRELTVAYETCSAPTDKLYLSYADAVAGSERTACFLWERLEHLFPDSAVIEAGESRLAAPLPALELARSSRKLTGILKQNEQLAPRVDRLTRAAEWRRGNLSAAGVNALFGPVVPMSATRMDLFNSCHFRHFMRFGMDAKPRQQARFSPAEYGTFVHEVLEVVLGKAAEHGGVKALAEDRDLRRALASAAADSYVEESLVGLEEETARFRYLFSRMKEAALSVVDSVVEELAVCDFTPARFELGFGKGKELPPIEVENGVTLSLSGFVDRVDEWMHDGKRYLRVIDYKTGKKNFSYSDVADGRGLQMLLYLFALERFGQQVMGPEEIVPAGVLYVPARNPVIKGERSMSAEMVAKERGDQLRRQGVVLNIPEVLQAMEQSEGNYRFLPVKEKGKQDYLITPEQMEKLDAYITDALSHAAGQMAEGNIAADPYWHDGMNNACVWCEYKSACHFEECCGDMRRLRKSLSGTEFWNALEQRKGGEQNGDQADT